MSAIKEFTSPQAKEFFDVATGEKEISIKNYTIIKHLLSPDYLVVQNKNEVVRLCATLVEDSNLCFIDEGNIDKLRNNDLEEFRIKAPKGSELKNEEKLLKEIAGYLNALAFNYTNSLKLVFFLEDRENVLMDKYNKLKEDYLALFAKDKAQELSVEKIEKQIDSDLKLTEEETKEMEKKEELEIPEPMGDEMEDFKEQPDLEATEGGIYNDFSQKE